MCNSSIIVLWCSSRLGGSPDRAGANIYNLPKIAGVTHPVSSSSAGCVSTGTALFEAAVVLETDNTGAVCSREGTRRTGPGVAGDERQVSEAVLVLQKGNHLGIRLDDVLRQNAVLRRQQRLPVLNLSHPEKPHSSPTSMHTHF